MAGESEEGVEDKGAVSPSAGLSTREGMAVEEVVVVGACWGWACMLQAWVARRMRMEERRLGVDMDVLDLGLAIAVEKEKKEVSIP